MLRQALEFIDTDKLIPSSNFGMAPLARVAALDNLGAMSAGTDIVGADLVGAAVPSAC